MNNSAKERKGQVALELLVVTSFLLIILIPTLVYILSVLSTESWKTDSQQAYSTLTKIVSVSNKLALLGEGSNSVETIYLPSSVKLLNVSASDGGREIYMRIVSGAIGTIDVVAVADIPLVLDPSKDWTEMGGSQVIYLNVSDNTVIISKPY